MSSPGGTVLKNLPASAGNARDTGLILGSGRSPGEGNAKPIQYSCLKSSTDRGAWGRKELDTTEPLSTAVLGKAGLPNNSSRRKELEQNGVPLKGNVEKASESDFQLLSHPLLEFLSPLRCSVHLLQIIAPMK